MKKELKNQRAMLGDTDEKYPVMKEIIENHWQ